MSEWHWIILGGVALLVFGDRAVLSDLVKDAAKKLIALRLGLQDTDGNGPGA